MFENESRQAAKPSGSSALAVGLRKPWAWVQPRGLDEVLARLADACDLAVPERERENMCSVAIDELRKLRVERDEWKRTAQKLAEDQANLRPEDRSDATAQGENLED